MSETPAQKQAREMAEARALTAWVETRPKPELPQGTTGLPNLNPNDPWNQHPPVDPNPLGLTPEEEAIGMANMHLISTESELLGRYMLNFRDVCDHLKLAAEGAQPAKRGRGRPPKPVDHAAVAAKQARSEAYKAWVKECQDRKARINAAKQELANRKLQRDEALRAWEASVAKAREEQQAQWETYLKEVEDALAYWEATPVPKQP